MNASFVQRMLYTGWKEKERTIFTRNRIDSAKMCQFMRQKHVGNKGIIVCFSMRYWNSFFFFEIHRPKMKLRLLCLFHTQENKETIKIYWFLLLHDKVNDNITAKATK